MASAELPVANNMDVDDNEQKERDQKREQTLKQLKELFKMSSSLFVIGAHDY